MLRERNIIRSVACETFMKQMPTQEFRHKTRIEDAMRLFLEVMRPSAVREVDLVPIEKARGRVLAQRVVAKEYLPPFNLSVVDGYAVRSIDLRGSSSKRPVSMRLRGESRLGEVCSLSVQRGEAVAVATGSMTPKGADAVVMVEDAKELKGGMVEFRMPVDRWQGITRKGEDVSPGAVILEKGNRLRPEDIGALKTVGLRRVQVVRRVRAGILSTGNELVESATKKSRGKIVDINRPILSGMLEELGAEVVDLGIVRDNEPAIETALRNGLAKSDLLLVTAGSSVGRRDLVPACINRLGRPGMVVHGVAMRPAMPTGLAVIRGKPVVSLPGFPVSAMVAFRVFVPALFAKLAGAAEPLQPTLQAVLSERITGVPGHRTFVRVRVKKVGDGYRADPLKLQRSSILSSMVHANGIVTVAESVRAIEAGTKVIVTLTGCSAG